MKNGFPPKEEEEEEEKEEVTKVKPLLPVQQQNKQKQKYLNWSLGTFQKTVNQSVCLWGPKPLSMRNLTDRHGVCVTLTFGVFRSPKVPFSHQIYFLTRAKLIDTSQKRACLVS